MNDVQNIYGLDGQQQSDARYLKKDGDTATGEIIFDAGIQVNNGLTEINGPAEFNNEVLFNVGSTVIVNGSVEITGPSLLVTSNLTEFNGATTEFNGNLITIGSNTAPNNTPVFTTYRSEVNLGDGGQGSVNVETAVNLGGFASLNLLNADINMEDDSIINQTGTRTIPNNMYSMNMIAGSQITFPDTTTQNSAYTGAAAFAGTYGPVQMTIDNNGKITSISTFSIPSVIPIGTVSIFGGAVPPSGYLLCQGDFVSQTTYASLYAVIGDYYLSPASPVAGMFRLPDMRKTFPIGAYDAPSMTIPYNPTGQLGYSTTYGGNTQMTINQMPDHSHSITWPSGSYVRSCSSTSNTSVGGTSTRLVTDNQETLPVNTNTVNTHSLNQGEFINNFICFNYIIKY